MGLRRRPAAGPGAVVSGSERRQRTELVGVRFSAEEYARLVACAIAGGVGVPELLRRRVADVIAAPNPNPDLEETR